MKALICPSLGPAENLVVTEVATPMPGDGEVLVEVAYAGLNFFDTLIIEGKYQVRPKPPFSPGAEFSGRVAALGPGTQGFALGDRVMGFVSHGAAAEHIAVPTNRLTKIPVGLALDKAAGLSVTYGTSMHALKQRAEMKASETLFVLGASGGVGLAAVEIGKAMGARVIAGASSEEKLAFARRYGAAETINTASDDMRTPQGARAQGRRRRLRSSRRRSHRSGPAFARVERTASGDWLRVGRDPSPAPQYPAVKGLRHQGRLLGRIHRPRAGGASREHGPTDGLGEVRDLKRSCLRHIPAGGLPEGV
jgi:threonine dehydrogenase-like Zn-dependent dehydrogenase